MKKQMTYLILLLVFCILFLNAPALAQSDVPTVENEELRQAGLLPELPTVHGTFLASADAIVADGKPEPERAPSPEDYVINDDLIVTGSECLGFYCADGESFGYDTLKLKEDNLRIRFDDTSAGTFPANDWQIIANDSYSGGDNYLAIEDSTAGRIPFRIMAGAPYHSLFVSSAGRVGLGTSVPVVNLHIASGSYPAIRLDQNTSGGLIPQVWDIYGNESHFTIRDTTGGYIVPFRIETLAPADSLYVRSNGSIGLGTSMPDYALEVERTAEDAFLVAHRTDGAMGLLGALTDTVQLGALTTHTLQLLAGGLPLLTLSPDGQVAVATPTGNTTMLLDPNGNLEIAGALTEASDVALKENFEFVDGGSVLARILQLPVTAWNYIDDGLSVRHMGPMAQDFYAAFGLGVDDTHIAPLDVNGVTLAGLQELTRLFQAQEAQIKDLQQENQELEQRLETLEAQLDALLAAQE